MISLYPDIEPDATHQIAVGQTHVLTVEECGNPDGIPVIVLHGGPGSHCKPKHRSFFNPSAYRIILFDQRGAGRSTPMGSVNDNTTWDLLADLETIREQFSINKWVIFGGSWGATLGLLYAQQYPENVLGLILRSTFLARKDDIHWGYGNKGVNRFFPKQWQAFTQILPKDGHWEHPLAIYYDHLTSQDSTKAHAAALAWAAWGGCVVSYGQFPEPTESSQTLLNEARIECHYMFNHCFIEENQLLRDIDKVADIPAILVHGQQDLVCPLESAYLLEQNWPAAQLKVIPTGGHLAHDPEMISALLEATDDMVKLLAL
ncbi:MAG: prolyl aminopeptidase [Candidatus Parabeggiatoa sp. nov. 3]|nr:MAG: prolyl aminopeptidase [Gammaproteobacteria bacterium]RKZ67203.1 MAG: prolyl aminopeptidase [Gammaproteobacteria bacterium]RKZ86170.1 MAG: prolyl aminopeptidase [Gammaproteobacteria bacterium]HEW98094.1 prolyl aminopeptidase [Beggiatoa sp.]